MAEPLYTVAGFFTYTFHRSGDCSLKSLWSLSPDAPSSTAPPLPYSHPHKSQTHTLGWSSRSCGWVPNRNKEGTTLLIDTLAAHRGETPAIQPQLGGGCALQGTGGSGKVLVTQITFEAARQRKWVAFWGCA